MKKIPIILCINIEPDPRQTNVSNPEPLIGYEKSYEYFRELRMPLEDLTRAKVNYLWLYRMDHQMEVTYGDANWAINHYPKQIQHILDRGDSVGLHPHPWQWQSEKGTWVNEFSDQSWIDFIVEDSLDNFKDTFGHNCEVFQFGDQFMNTKIMNLIRKRRVKYDISVEPGYQMKHEGYEGEVWKGFEVNTMGVGRMPYYPSASDYKKSSLIKNTELLAIPVSSGKVWYEFGRVEKLYRKVFNPEMLQSKVRSLNLGFLPPKHFAWIVEDLFKEMQDPYLTVLIRSDAGSDPYQRKNLEQNMKYLMDHPLSDQFIFVKPDQLVGQFNNVVPEKEFVRV